MPIQTASATSTIATTNGDTIFTLLDVTDEMLTYSVSKFDGVDITDVAKRPQLTILRKAASPRNGYKTVYSVRYVRPNYNALGAKLQSTVVEIVLTESQPTFLNTDFDVSEEMSAVTKFCHSTFFLAMVSDGSFAR